MELTLFDMILDPEDGTLGLKQTSMVGSPAIMTAWAKFNNGEVKLSVLNSAERIVFGPALIPGLPIERVVMGQKFYLQISPEEITKVAIKMAQDGIHNKLDTNHDNSLVEGCTIFEVFQTNENRVKPSGVKGYESLPEKTLFFTAKVNNDVQWARVESGELTGFSIDGLFKFKEADTITTKEAQSAIKAILSSH